MLLLLVQYGRKVSWPLRTRQVRKLWSTTSTLLKLKNKLLKNWIIDVIPPLSKDHTSLGDLTMVTVYPGVTITLASLITINLLKSK